MPGREDIFQKAMNEGHSAAWDQEWSKAASSYRKALQEIPDQPKALNSLGLALFQLGIFDEALQIYKRVAQISPQDPVPMEKLAQLLERTGQLAKIGGWEVNLQTMKLSWSLETFRIADLEPPTEPPLEEGINLFAPEVRPIIAAAVRTRTIRRRVGITRPLSGLRPRPPASRPGRRPAPRCWRTPAGRAARSECRTPCGSGAEG